VLWRGKAVINYS